MKPIPPAAIVPPITDALLAELRRVFHADPDAPLSPLTGDVIVPGLRAALDELARFRELLGRRYCDEVELAIAVRAAPNVVRFPIRVPGGAA